MPRGDKNIGKRLKGKSGRKPGSKNKTPILMQELESIVFELSKEERIERLREYRDFSDHKNPHRNYVNMHITVAKRQEENSGQGDLFNDAEERALIMAAEKKASTMEQITH